jgi:diketogulonate reductase-like aldo/keto reductase
MRSAPFGSTGVSIPVAGQGTWKMEQDDRRSCVAALRAGIEAGMTHVDTAELYGSGRVEELVGEAIAGLRDRLYLVSKVLPQNATRAGTVRACEQSLRRLRTDHLDCYLLHWDGPHPLADTIAGFEELRGRGLIKAWGVSNFDADQVAEAVTIGGPGSCACNQVLYHLKERSIEHAVLPRCEQLGVALVGYSPFGSGDFPEPRSKGGQALARVAAARGATPHQVALAFLTRRPALFTIPKTASAARAAENAGAGDLTLSADDLAVIEAAFPLGRPRSGVPYL